jgi:hypothetical protein
MSAWAYPETSCATCGTWCHADGDGPAYCSARCTIEADTPVQDAVCANCGDECWEDIRYNDQAVWCSRTCERAWYDDREPSADGWRVPLEAD